MVDSALPVARAVVVSLPGSDRRRGFFAQPLAGVFEVAEAFHGATQDWTPYFDAARFAERYGRAPVAAEIGCAISHARVIRGFAAEAGADLDVLLVAEDDARFTEDFARVGRTLLQSRLAHDVVVLGDGWTRHRRTAVRRHLTGISQVSRLSRVLRGRRRLYRVGRFAGHGDCAGLYAITRRAARAFDNYIRSLPGEKLEHVADAWPAFRELCGWDVALTRPSLVTWSGGSTILAPEDQEREAAELAAAPPLTLRDRLVLLVAARSRIRGARLALRATVDDLAFRWARRSGRGERRRASRRSPRE
ncbi:glycosyltransferase family 25 protein [Kocuria rhizophila]|uniref:glycosyltransferase family 25 protein n=1 Tax=Kocuria rhizophila TaxID=72000 RepID=UPI0021A38360|nr:glycosyltransferase family 25 protein [Kocuria rhizophila]MCT1916087.1 glycosyltransferase family 25 protein [Kocuria rhizophila]